MQVVVGPQGQGPVLAGMHVVFDRTTRRAVTVQAVERFAFSVAASGRRIPTLKVVSFRRRAW